MESEVDERRRDDEGQMEGDEEVGQSIRASATSTGLKYEEWKQGHLLVVCIGSAIKAEYE